MFRQEKGPRTATALYFHTEPPETVSGARAKSAAATRRGLGARVTEEAAATFREGVDTASANRLPPVFPEPRMNAIFSLYFCRQAHSDPAHTQPWNKRPATGSLAAGSSSHKSRPTPETDEHGHASDHNVADWAGRATRPPAQGVA
ncbi:hypothetical protein AAFF_G00201860 [Aldrovandia affinis]|uniref:Uncharacterized protein n=1 Tax=Aldrovandia affinis TaxID=143900 RepID=A0AAD7WV80_9TELE|nr:hypothetical protein AAFF_G00201860 [Aldrovandia affinis]